MKTILFNPETKDCTSTVSKESSKRFEQLLSEGYMVVGTVYGMNVTVTKYRNF